MSYNFRIAFSGLCAFVPDKDLDKNPDSVDVLLISTEPDNEDLESLSKQPEEHYPVLRFDLANVKDGNGSVGGGFGVWSLDREDVTITTRKISGAAGPNGRKLVVTTGGPDSFDRVPAIGEVLAGAGGVDPDLLGDDILSPRVIARFRLNQGTLKVDEFGKFNNQNVLVQFVPQLGNGPLPERPLPHRVGLEMQLDDDEEVVITSRKFGSSSRAHSAVLHPTREQRTLLPEDDIPPFEVRVINLCCGYFLEEGGEHGNLPEPDDDFECFYMLCDNFTNLVDRHSRLPVPVPIKYLATPLRGGQRLTGGGDTIKCSVARMSASTSTEDFIRAPRAEALPADGNPQDALPDLLNLTPLAMAAGAAGQPALLDFSIERQDPRKYWCWAAVTASIHTFFGGNGLGKCKIVSKALKRSGCCQGNVQACDEPFPLAKVLHDNGHLEGDPIEAPLSFDEIKQEIGGKKRPIACVTQDGSGIGHAVVIYGFDESPGRRRVYVADPAGGKKIFYNYVQLVNKGGIQWITTCRTK